ncbi:MAG TPA: HAMP domain-containing protein, partial [Polyangiaceae bacterium]|nr:HAMP domain-containing protein [Polyangiaceae bacterium]
MAQAASSAPTTGRHQRKLKNYLLDPHFQLKYTAYLVAITVALGGSLGLVVWQTSDQVVAQSYKNVEQGQRVVGLGREVVGESRKVSEVVKMNIVKDPVYQDNPALLEAFTTDAKKQDQRLQEQEAQLVAQADSLKHESSSLKAFQSRMMLTLVGVMLLLVVGIFVAGIMVTHKVAGPIYKMKRM